MTHSLSRRRLIQVSTALAATTLPAIQTSSSSLAQVPDSLPEALVRMSPQPGSNFGLPGTTISFRDITVDQLGFVKVAGSLSGPASGVLREHSDGNGASWIHDSVFFDGETVTVSAETPLTRSADGSASFTVGMQAPRPMADTTTQEEPVDESVIHHFRSRPDLSPIITDITIEADPRVAPGLVAATPHVPNGQSGATIIDNNGDPVWHHVASDPSHPIYCLKMLNYLGQPVLTWSEGSKKTGYGYTHFVIMDQSYETIGYVQGGNGVNGLDVHDLVFSDYGTAWVFSYHPVWVDDGGIYRNVLECVIQEIDVSTGDVWWEWHSLDHVPLEDSFSPRPESPENSWDYIHVNSIEVDFDGNLLISSRSNHAIYRISTQDHSVIWRLGGKNSDFEIAEDAVFHWQHDARRLADGTVSLFDNVDSDNQVDSRGMVFELDEASMTANLLREYRREGGMHSPYQANMQTLDNGNVFIGWGSGPRCSEFTHEGETLFELRYRAGVSYRGYRVDWRATPSRPIDYLLEEAEGGVLTCFVSWNGATDVAEWRVVSGTGAELARSGKAGFETELTGIAMSPYMEIQALNAAGQVLGGRVLNWGG